MYNCSGDIPSFDSFDRPAFDSFDICVENIRLWIPFFFFFFFFFSISWKVGKLESCYQPNIFVCSSETLLDSKRTMEATGLDFAMEVRSSV